MRYRRQIEARAVCRDWAGAVLVVPAGSGDLLPGGTVDHGEDPADAVARGGAAQVGVALELGRTLLVVTDVTRLPGRWRSGWAHRDTIIYAAVPVGGATGGSWVAATGLSAAGLAPVTAVALGQRDDDLTGAGPTVAWSAVQGPDRHRRQRFAAYGHVTDAAGRVLLAQIADGFPGEGRWHLPGGGTDFGESARAGLARELAEETGQEGEIGPLLAVSHRHSAGSGVDWHGVRVVYAVRVERPSAPTVMERGGSTSAAAWFPVARALELPLTDVAHDALIGVTPG